MTVEVLELLAIRMKGELRRLAPGERLELPEEYGEKLLQRALGKVRLVSERLHETDLTGSMVTWQSPLFGLLRAACLGETGNAVVVRHPLTDKEASIPKAWLVRPPD